MHRLALLIAILNLLIPELSFAFIQDDYLQYIHPKAGSQYVPCETNIIIRFQNKWYGYLRTNQIKIQSWGSKSGPHEGRIIQANDRLTFLFQPFQQFLPSESVHVNISANLPGFDQSITYDFITSNRRESASLVPEEKLYEYDENSHPPQFDTYGEVSVINGVAVPSDFPRIDVKLLGESASGRLFLNNLDGVPYIMILENDGTPYYYKRIGGRSWDFKVQPTGTITHRVDRGLHCFVELDTNYNVIDTLDCGPGYHVNQHDVQLLTNGNYMILVWDEQTIDMSQLLEEGDTSATVVGNHLQELDRNGNVIFEWRSWDHFDILDAVHFDLTANYIDYVHMNSLAIDYDDHIIISSRNLSEVTKINKNTGEIIWRLGGENNQFTFLNDENSISYQHDARPVPNKPNYYTLFDNGNYHSPQISRAIEFYLDTLNMTATKIWEYRPNPDRYVWRMGNVQRLPNGNTLINWALGPLPKVTEVTAEGEVVYEMNFSQQSESYRSFRFDWFGRLKAPYLILEKYDNRITLIFNKFGDTDVVDYIIYAGLEPNTLTPIDTISQTWIDLTDFKDSERYYFRVTARNYNEEESEFSNEVNALINFITPGDNMILNGDFTDGDLFWELEVSEEATASGSIEGGVYNLTIDTSGISELDVQLRQGDICLQQGKNYILEFDAYADAQRTIEVNLEKAKSPYDNYSRMGFSLIETTPKHFSHDFEMTSPSDFQAQIVLNCGHWDINIYFDNISLREDISSTITGESKQIPNTYRLYQNYPNPFNPLTTIRYAIPSTGNVKISIFNILGQIIDEPVNALHNPGSYQVTFNNVSLSSGIYYYQMEARELTGKVLFNEVRKMMVIK